MISTAGPLWQMWARVLFEAGSRIGRSRVDGKFKVSFPTSGLDEIRLGDLSEEPFSVLLVAVHS